jgi:DNA-binding CsgD family transcriptional regulator
MGPESDKKSGAPPQFPDRLAQELLSFARDVPGAKAPKDVLNGLHSITSKRLHLNVLCAIRFPQRVTDWDALALGKTVFLHSSVARGWWEEWIREAPYKLPAGYALARLSLGPHTWTESLQMLQPIGADRWGYELALKYGARDGYSCPIGGRWLLGFWSATPLGKEFTEAARIMIFAAASFAVIRLDQLAIPGAAKPGEIITPREAAVLRLLSIGMPFKEAAQYLGLGEETIRTHLKKVQVKLGVRNRTHAVAEALRRHMIP